MTEEWVRYYDERGQQIRVRASEWARRIAPSSLREVWDDVDRLERELVLALEDGVCDARIAAAEHLDELDPRAQRGSVVLARALCAHGRVDEARRRLTRELARGAPSAGRLAALSLVQAALGDPEAARASARAAVELDPNHASALARWVESARSKPEAEAALQHAARLPGAWRARLWLGRRALAAGDLQGALRDYREALALAGEDRDEAVRGAATDLATSGHHVELVALLAPGFDGAPALESRAEQTQASNGLPHPPAAPRPPRGSEPGTPASRSWPRTAPPRERPEPPPTEEVRDPAPSPAEARGKKLESRPSWVPMGSPLGALVAGEPGAAGGPARVGFLYSGSASAPADPQAQLAALPLHVAAALSGETDVPTEWFAAGVGTPAPTLNVLLGEWSSRSGPEYAVFGHARTGGWLPRVEYEVWDVRRKRLLARIRLTAWTGRRGLARRLERAVGRSLAAAGAVRRRRRLTRSLWRVGPSRLLAAATLAASRLAADPTREDGRHLAHALRAELARPDPVAWLLAAGALGGPHPRSEDWELAEALCQTLDGLRSELPDALQRGFERWLRQGSGR